jgi:hypothetical protein
MPVGRKTRRAQDAATFLDIYRAGFEPCVLQGPACDRFSGLSIPPKWPGPRRGSKPARMSLMANLHVECAEFFALPTLGGATFEHEDDQHGDAPYSENPP